MYLEIYEIYEKYNFVILFYKIVCVWVFFDIFYIGIFDFVDYFRYDYYKQREDFDEFGYDCCFFCVRDVFGCK